MTAYAAGVAMLAAAAVIWCWLVLGCVELVLPLSRANKAIAMAMMLAIMGTAAAPYAKNWARKPPIKCGDGADYDTRDNLCYPSGSVPPEFQKR